MYINRATLFFATGCAVIVPCLSLPLNGPAVIVEPRATYAVVPINGGSGQGGAGSGAGSPGGSGSGSGNGSGGGSGPGKQFPSPVAPVTVTVVQTPPARTSFHTVFMTPSKATDRVTDTVVITKTVEIVNIKPDTTITTSASGTISIAPNEATPRSSAISLSPKPSALTSTTSTISITLGFSTTATPASATSDTSTTVPAAVQTEFIGSSTTYDNGQWHTSYPVWNGTNLRRRLRLQPVAGLQ